MDSTVQNIRVSEEVDEAIAQPSHKVNPIATPLTHIENAEAIRFETPVPPTFSVLASLGSIASLIAMSVLSTLMYLALTQPELSFIKNLTAGGGFIGEFIAMLQQASNSQFAAWVWLPFAFTIFGSTLGWLFELGLLITGTPFQLARSSFTRFITQVRLLNLAPVTATIFFFVCAMVVQEPNLRMALLFLSAATLFGLGFALFFATRAPVIQFILLGVQVLQAGIVLAASSGLTDHIIALLVGQAVLQLAAFLVGTATPIRSTIFHITSTIAGILLFIAVVQVTALNATFSLNVAPEISLGSLLMWGLLATCIAGLVISIKSFPDAYNNFRSLLSDVIWTPLYFKLVSAERFPNPENLSTVYDKVKPKKTPLMAYYQAHPLHLMQSLSIPAVADKDIEANVTVFKVLMKQAAGAFKLIGFLDHNLPQSKLTTPLNEKPRLPIWSDGNEFWPNLFKKTIFGATLPNGGKLHKAPRVALSAFKEGQLLAYLTSSGIANTFAKPAKGRAKGTLIIDFRFLEKYETKADYESYGGVAYFKVNAETKSLDLISVIAPLSNIEILANPHDPEFRRAESLVLASLYFQVISGKHLAEIHMTYNLVEVSMHNAFDAQEQWTHPFRTFMYLHFFSHELAEEMTTEHLVQERAVFTQIFSTTHDEMINHLNDTYANFNYGEDEDFEARAAAMTLPDGSILPHACIKWELEYFEIWHKYTTDLIDIIYADDEAVQNDKYIQDFHHGLLQVMLKGLPDRYDAFQTKKGVARFAADTIHHAVVRHQVYGTTGLRAALDPRISTTQVPRDTGTQGVDEWRSLAYVALATGEARFTLLTGKEGKDFTYLLDGIDDQYRKPMVAVFGQLQTDLLTLDEKWTAGVVEREFNENYFRALPSDIHTGPGY